MKRITYMSVIITVCVLLGGQSQPLGRSELSQLIEQLRRIGVSCRFIDDETVELTQGWSGFRRIKTLRDPDEGSIRTWLQMDMIPLLEIDPRTIDTTHYLGWYTYWTSVPVSNGYSAPAVTGDLNRNGKPEVFGGFRDFNSTDYGTRVYEIDSEGLASLQFTYIPRRGPAMQLSDVDSNGLQEVVFMLGDTSYFYEQPSADSLPVNRKFTFPRYTYHGTAIWTLDKICELDQDTSIDFLYRGTQPDSTGVWNYMYYTYVAKYDESIGNFKKVWQIQLEPPPGESGLGGYDVGDYDGDGKMNFLASDITGKIWVCENTGEDSYHLSWTDSLSLVNLDYQTSGDVDGDGTREFFVGATMGDGNWTVEFSADSDDHYSPRFAFHLLSGGSLDEPTYMAKDIDGDGKSELMIWSGGLVYIFKSNAPNSYYLWYFSKNFDGMNINFADLNHDGKEDIIVGREQDSATAFRFYSDLYLSRIVTSVDDRRSGNLLPREATLYQNYPNPFNPSTKITFQLPRPSQVLVGVFDMLGHEVAVLVNGSVEAGVHTVTWNAGRYPSGVYFCRMVAFPIGSHPGRVYGDVKKLIILR